MERNVNVRISLSATLLALGLVPATALANTDHSGPYDSYGQYRYAQVIDVVPLVRIDEVDVPTRICEQDAQVVGQGGVDDDHARPYDPMHAPSGRQGVLSDKLVARDGQRDAQPRRPHRREIGFRRVDDRSGSFRDERIREDRWAIDPDRRYEGGPSGDRYTETGARVQILPRVETTVTCRLQHDVEQRQTVEGYRVTYEYRGERYVTETSADPGPRIRVQVSARPQVR